MWSTPFALLSEEMQQRRDEGVQLPEILRSRVEALDPIADAWNEAAIWPIYDELMLLPADPVLEATEPDDLDAIRALRPTGPRDLRWSPDDSELIDRLHGAWTGRATGCALGKPVELMGMHVRGGELTGRADIKRYLELRDEWPLKDYFSGRDAGDGVQLLCPSSTREHIAYMEPDDDIHYSLVGLGVLEDHGPQFTWNDVAAWWMRHIPMADLCTAEVQAMLNWLSRTARVPAGAKKSTATAEFCRMHRNPYREWIGAQIRSDGWAWACAGKPELAAEFAHRDASWTHTRNGIYGEMFFAAVQAAAFVENDPYVLIQIGLSEIPSECRLAQAVQRTLEICTRTDDWESAMVEIETLSNAMSAPVMNPVHTINNAAICVMSLLKGRMDTVDAITLSVMAGLDTDCNGATVGSVVGAATGMSGMRMDLATRLHDTIRPNLIGFTEVTMADLARRTAVQWHRVDDYHATR